MLTRYFLPALLLVVAFRVGLNIAAGTNFNISGSEGKDIDDHGVVNNSGHTTLSGTGYLRGLGSSTFNNLKGATFTLASDAPFNYYDGANTFNNLTGATFEKTVGVSTTPTLLNWAFNNSGLTRASKGVLALNGDTISTDAGTFTSNTSGIVRFIGGTHTLKTGTLFNGTGKSQLAGATLAVTGSAVIGSASAPTTFEVSNEAISGTTTSSLTAYGTFNWTGGRIGGKLTVASKATLNLLGTDLKDIDAQGSINNSGFTVWKGPGVLRGLGASTFNNLSGGVFDVQNDGPLFGDYNGNNVFKNAGTFTTGLLGVGKTTMTWGFTQFSTGTLSVDLNGLDAANYDLFSIGGTATLAGTVKVTRPANFLPPLGSNFKFLICGARLGQFTTLIGGDIDATRKLQLVHNANDVTLTVVSKTAASPRRTASDAPSPTVAPAPTATPVVTPTPVQEPTPIPAPTRVPSASASVSTASVNVGNSSVQLSFAQMLEATAATDLTHYAVTINGRVVELSGISVKGNVVTLLIPEGSLHANDSFIVTLNGLKDRNHQALRSGSWSNDHNPT